MGGMKNQLIESQVEVGDRIPQPIPYLSHVAVSRRSLREQDMMWKRTLRRETWELVRMFLLGVALGVTTMILIGVA